MKTHSTVPAKPRARMKTKIWCGSQRRSAAPQSMASVAGTMPCQTEMPSASPQPRAGDSRAASPPTTSSSGTARGQPSMSTTSGAEDHCNCSGMRCSVGRAQIQGSSTSTPSSGVTRGEAMRSCGPPGPVRPASMRQGRSHSAVARASRAMLASRNMAGTTRSMRAGPPSPPPAAGPGCAARRAPSGRGPWGCPGRALCAASRCRPA